MPSSAPHPSRRAAVRERPKPPNPVVTEAEKQWIFTEDELLRTPSIIDGMPLELEKGNRKKGANFILQIGILLKLPQMTLSTACVFFNRFLMRQTLVAKPAENFKPMHHYQVAATSLFLATKVEENCRKMKELIVACVRVATKNPNAIVDEQTKDYWKWRDTILYNEDVLLETLCFDLSLEPTHKLMYDMLVYLGVQHDKRLRDAAWAFLNDSALTSLCLLFSSRTIAAAALFAGAKMCNIAFPDEDGKPWWEIQYVNLKDIRRACNHMAENYEHVPDKDVGGHSIYVGLRTPEDEDPLYAITRLRPSQTPISPAASSVGMERSASDQSLKRKRDDGVGMERSASEQSTKKRREDGPENGITNGISSRRNSKPGESKPQNGEAPKPAPVQNGSTSQSGPAQNGVASKPEASKNGVQPEANGASKPESKDSTTAIAIPQKEEDDVSEEGEVEE
ncbi:cyclin-like protein [Lophium mytilinum]|uniref:RNA polymerase II holoenzyme cyclin-like subunit n=1 Tax=Lophium mytilinum TaxID=390894 RepID=A0A6A6R6E2_9PEZI|nr:cyclin-like protein [Lophium mytilinum]